MKLKDNHWETYIANYEKENYHPSLKNIIKYFQTIESNFPNLILHGPSSSGKYTQALSIISNYSDSKLKYEKKLSIETGNKNPENYIIKMSDIHFEVDFDLLGCNSKHLWNCIYTQILEIITCNLKINYFILCKNFQNINIETLNIFYSYLQKSYSNVNLSFIILSTSISFIPENISNLFLKIPISKKEYNKFKMISNKKNIIFNIIDELIKQIICYKQIQPINIRNSLYNILTFNHSINEFIELFSFKAIEIFKLNNEKCLEIIKSNQKCLYYFQNNYRPIFHLESYFYNIVKIVNEL